MKAFFSLNRIFCGIKVRPLFYCTLNLFLFLGLFSCASLLNDRTKIVSVVTPIPTILILKNDTFPELNTCHSITVNRTRKPLELTVFNDSIQKSIKIKSTVTKSTWLNLAFLNASVFGFLLDTHSKRIYNYPDSIFVDLENRKKRGYYTYNYFAECFLKNKQVLKFKPILAISGNGPGMEFFYERKTARAFSTEISFGWYLDHLNVSIPLLRERKGYKVGIEQKFYPGRLAPLGEYYAFEIHFFNQKYYSIDEFGLEFPEKDTSMVQTSYVDTFGINRKKLVFNLKFGKKFNWKNFELDIFCGLGLAYRSVVHFDRLVPGDFMQGPRHPNITFATNSEGKFWLINFPLGVKFGWCF